MLTSVLFIWLPVNIQPGLKESLFCAQDLAHIPCPTTWVWAFPLSLSSYKHTNIFLKKGERRHFNKTSKTIDNDFKYFS